MTESLALKYTDEVRLPFHEVLSSGGGRLRWPLKDACIGGTAVEVDAYRIGVGLSGPPAALAHQVSSADTTPLMSTPLVSTPLDAGPNQDWTHGAYYGSRGTFFADVTGDRRADAIVVNNDTVTVRLSLG